MENKRSVGVTVFAWSLIIISFLGLITVPGMEQSYQFLSKRVLACAIIYALISSVVAIIAGINLLRLKEWSRRLTVALIILGFLEMFFFVPINHRSAKIIAEDMSMKTMIEQQYDNIAASTKAKIGVSKEEFVKHIMNLTTRAAIIITGFLEIMLLVYSFLLLWFFTRPNVRRQFS